MAQILYLDADDEITSAAARLRNADEGRVALVVPYGSRLSTSRINFRLLAREAQTRNRRLAIVTPDTATRALAASAGLPVFSSVGEYEETADRPDDRSASGRPGAAVAAQPASEQDDGDRPDLQATRVLPAAADEPAAARPSSGRSGAASSRSLPVAPGRRRLPFGRTAGLVGLAVLTLALLAGGVAGYLLLPSARVTVTAHQQPVGPVDLTIRADPSVAVVDPAANIVPAERLSFDLAANDTFRVTGRKVDKAKATGQVTFRSKDPTASNTIAGGSIVATPGGIRFRTLATVTLPPAALVGLTIVPSQIRVRIEAVKDGPEGNVDANTITVIPRGEDPLFTDVRNEDPTTGGKLEETPRIVQADIDAAVSQLTKQLGTDFAGLLADPGQTPPGKTVFPETQSIADPAPTVDPTTLLGREVDTFDLGLTSTGTVIAVDASPVETIAASRIRDSVGQGYRIVEGSVVVEVHASTVEGEIVSFPVTARAAQVRVLDAAAIRGQIRGRPVEEARSLLAPYGEVELSTWPDWVTTIPTIDGRIEVNVVTDDAFNPNETSPASTPGGSGSPEEAGSPAASASALPSASGTAP